MANRSALTPVQTALYSTLTTDSTLMALVSGVYDSVPEPAVYPFVVIGEAIEMPANEHGSFGSRVSCTIHVWSEYRGFAQVNTMLDCLVRLLDHAPVVIGGRTLVAIRLEQILTLRDSDPDIRHGVARFTVETY